MGPTSSGLDTLMALATNCPGNSVLLVARTCFVTTGAELAQPMARQETAPRSVAMALSVILFMTSLPSRSQGFELVFRICERAGHGIVPGPTHSATTGRSPHCTITVTDAVAVFPAASRATADTV